MEKITKYNVDSIKVGDTIRYHNGYEWSEHPISEHELSRGGMHADHNETAWLLNPSFGGGCYIVKRAGNDYQI